MAVGANATTFSGLSEHEGLIPKPMAKEIIENAYGSSLAGQLAGTVAMPITGTSIAWQVGEPVAGVVGEGELKPVINTRVATKSATPIKVAAIMYWSKEARQANPLGYLGMLKNTGASAIRRAIDLAVFHGKNGLTNSTISGVEYIAQTENKVDLGTGTTITDDILAGYQLVVDGENDGDVTGWAADPRLRVKLMQAKDPQGNYMFTSNAGRGGIDLKDPMGDLAGLPVAFGKAVSGKLGTVPDSGIRLIGGDFSENIKFGYVEQMTYRRSDQAIIQDGDVSVNLFQQNMEAYIVEAQFGWIIRDVNDFVLYNDPAVTGA